MRKGRKYRRILIVILVLAAFLRVAHFQQMKANNPIFNHPIVDSREYVDDALHYLNKNFLGPEGSYFHPPFYSYFVAFVFKLFGSSVDSVKIFQIFLDLLNLLLIYLISSLIFNKSVGLIGASSYAVYIPVIQLSVEILPPVLIIFLFLISTLFLIKLRQSCDQKNAKSFYLIISCLSLGILIITLPNFLLCVPLTVFWILRYFKNFSLKKRLKYAAILVGICLIPICLTALRNNFFSGEKVLISHSGGINFYIGNNPDIKKTVSLRPGIEWERLLMVPYKKRRITNSSEQSQFFLEKGIRFISKNPVKWAGLLVKKTILFFNSYEFPRNFDQDFFKQYSWVAKLPLVRLNIVFPLALAAIFFLLFTKFSGKNHQDILLLIWLILAYSVSIILIFIAGRYRLPIVPFYIVFSSYFVYFCGNTWKRREYKRLSIPIGLFVLFLVFSNIHFFKNSYPYTIQKAHTYSLVADGLMDQKKYGQALSFFNKALQFSEDGSTYELYNDYARYWLNVGDQEKAVKYFQKSVQLNPGNHRALNSLGFLFKMKGDFNTAIDYLITARKAAPCYPQIYLNLADCCIGQKDMEGAVSILESYHDFCPSPHSTISYNLGKLYMDKFRNWEKAINNFKEAIKYPQSIEISPETYNRLGACFYHLKKFGKARQIWLKGLKISPDYKPIKRNLSALDIPE